MSLILCYDTETTGLPLYDQPSDDPRQPHVAQLAAVLFEEKTRQVVASIDLVIRPDGWVIPDEVAAIHGITTERACLVGVRETSALTLFDELWQVASKRLAYNESFDARIMRIAYKRYRTPLEADMWKDGNGICAARLATPIMNMAPTEAMRAVGRNHAKMPKLSEAFHFFMGKQLENAHSAIVDVQAAMQVYFKILDGVRLPAQQSDAG